MVCVIMATCGFNNKLGNRNYLAILLIKIEVNCRNINYIEHKSLICFVEPAALNRKTDFSVPAVREKLF